MYDPVIASNVKIHGFKIFRDLSKSFKLAHSCYTQLAKRKDTQRSMEQAVKRKISEEDIVVVKKKVEDCIESFKPISCPFKLKYKAT